MSTIPSDPGDAAALCFDGLSRLGDVSLKRLHGALARGGRPSSPTNGLQALHDEVVDHLRREGVVPPRLPTDAGPAYAVLKAIDATVGDLDPSRSGAVPPALGYLRFRLLDTGRFNTDTSGAVIPRHCFPGRPGAEADGLAGHLGGLIRVTAETWDMVALWRPRIDPLTVDTRGSRGLAIAAVPFYGRRGDIAFREHHVPGDDTPSYSAGPAESLDRQDRVARSLRAMDESGAVLGLVPELTLDDRTLREWRAQILASATTRTSLAWVLLGTGSVAAAHEGSQRIHAPASRTPMAGPPPAPHAVNQAVLMDAKTGQIVLTQAKQRGFTITRRNVESWGLDDELTPSKHVEWLDSPRQLQVLDTAHGRLAVLICEDLGRTMSIGAFAAEVGVALVLTPIFGALIIGDPAYHAPAIWSHSAAESLSTEIGSRVAVCNSSAVTRRYNGTGSPTTTLFTTRPYPPPVEAYGVDLERGEPVGGVDTAALSPEDDAVTARTATL